MDRHLGTKLLHLCKYHVDEHIFTQYDGSRQTHLVKHVRLQLEWSPFGDAPCPLAVVIHIGTVIA